MSRLNVIFDERDSTVTLLNRTPPVLDPATDIGIVIEYPDGIVQDLGQILTAANSHSFSMPFRAGVNGRPMEGQYRFTVTDYISDSIVAGPEVYESVVSLPAAVEISEDIRVLEPYVGLSDDTDYATAGWSIDIAVTRSWSYTRGAVLDYGTGVDFPFSYGGIFYSGEYDWTFESVLTYKRDTFLFLIAKNVASGSVAVTSPPMLSEIQVLINCLLSKFINEDCCENALAAEQKETYIYVTSLFESFIVNGQAGITDGQQDRLDKILATLRKYGCADDGTIADVSLGAYDWCLCEGGGGGFGTRDEYLIAPGVWISSDAVEEVDKFTYAAAGGVGTITQVLADSRIFTGTIVGDAGDATYTSNGATDSFKLVIPTHGDANASYLSAFLATVAVWSAPQATPTDSAPWVKDAGSVQVRVTGITANTISIVFTGIGATYPSGWAVTFVCP